MATDNASPTETDSADPSPTEVDSPPQGRLASAAPMLCRGLVLLFFVLLAAHVTLNINPRVLYGADEAPPAGKLIPQFPVYLQGAEFFQPFLEVPGGVTEYLGANLSQYFSTLYGGAAILVACALASFWLTGRLIVLLGGRKRSVLRFVAPVLLVVVWNGYAFVLADQIALLAAWVVACYYLRLPDQASTRATVLVPGMAAFYYIAGAPVIVLALVCGLYELIGKGRLIGGLYLLAGGLTPLVLGTMVFGLGGSEAYLRLAGLIGRADIASAAWCGLAAFAVLLTVGLTLRSQWAAPAEPDADQPTREGRSNAERLLALSVGMVIVAIGVATTTLDKNVRTFCRLCFASQAKAWGAVIVAGRTAADTWPAESYTADTCRIVNRALFEQGRLGVQMFAYPQSPNGGLLPTPGLREPFKADTLMQMGAVDSAQRLAEESLARWGYRPFVVRLLAKIAIVKNDWDAAEDYLQMLAKDIVHGAEAKRSLARIRSGDRFRDDQDIQQIRSYWLVGHEYDPHDVQTTLEALLGRNLNNQMAFEYLMAHYLLTLQLESFAERVGHISHFEYQYMPTQFAEALVLHYSLTNQWQAIEDLPPDAGAMERSQRFIALARQHAGDQDALAAAVLLEMPGSYFGYYFQAIRIVAERS